MKKALLKNILIIFLAIIALFSIFKYASLLKEKNDLLNSLNQLRQERQALEMEKQNLLQTLEKQIELQQRVSQQNYVLKEYLQASKKRLTRLFEDFQELQKKKGQLDSRYTLLKAENAALRQESESLKLKLSSITELKKAIKELKGQMRKVGLKMKKTADTLERLEWNRGFLLKDGKSTYSTKIKIKVIPVTKK
jgi:chromosome segregation ATPase